MQLLKWAIPSFKVCSFKLWDSNHDSSVAMTQLFMCAKDHFDWLNNFGNMRPNPKGNLFWLNCLYATDWVLAPWGMVSCTITYCKYISKQFNVRVEYVSYPSCDLWLYPNNNYFLYSAFHNNVSMRFTLVPSAPKTFSNTILTSTLAGTHLYSWVKRSNHSKVSCSRTQLPQSRPGFEPTLGRLSRWESDALNRSTRVPQLSNWNP